ncbi:DUF1360 domain-containing protein [Bacillus sp. AGMB 02131]|uniref:DUF1360 domain-containing protein n=1 Tax=Peribacillus faecalis TaxID=2772559 RepID=A0A927CYS3_9BACI|nr:DUF1360 domain-containing protein [Peribacillus faecalis]MBD3110161.1 DUF1360 domain-containing protein [Peribacillus faecalis]
MINHTLDFIILSLACFRLTRLIVYDKITAFLRKPFFDEVEEKDKKTGTYDIYYVPKPSGIRKWIGELLSCYWCTGIWSATALVIFAFFYPVWYGYVAIVLAVAGLASLIEMVVQQLIYE